MKLLRQENAQLTFKGAPFNLIGVDYQRERTNEGHKRQTLADMETLVRRDMLNILLSHNPNSFPRAAELGIELSLAGHTHGGQIQVEILDHRLSPARFITDYIAGLYQRPLFAPSLDTPRQRVEGYSEAPKNFAAGALAESPGFHLCQSRTGHRGRAGAAGRSAGNNPDYFASRIIFTGARPAAGPLNNSAAAVRS